MALSDLFKPKWQHSNLQKRLNAVAQIEDQDLLAKIAKLSDSRPTILAAMKKITSQEVLASIAQSHKDSWVREQAVSAITDQETLYKITKNSNEEFEVRLSGAKLLTDQSLLTKVAMENNGQVFQQTIIDKLEEEASLIEVVKNSKSVAARGMAAKKIKNQEALKNLLGTVKDDSVIKQLLPSINDKELIKETFTQSESAGVRQHALLLISDEDFLLNVAKNHSGKTERLTAISRLKDDQSLYVIAKYGKTEQEKLTSIGKMKSQELLLQLLGETEEPKKIKIIVKKIGDKERILDVLERATSIEFCQTVLECLDNKVVEKIARDTKNEILNDLIKEKRYTPILKNTSLGENKRVDAVKHVVDVKILAEIAKQSEHLYFDLKNACLERIKEIELQKVEAITNQEQLINLVLDSNNEDYVIHDAVKKVSNLEDLTARVKKSCDTEVAGAFIKSEVADQETLRWFALNTNKLKSKYGSGLAVLFETITRLDPDLEENHNFFANYRTNVNKAYHDTVLKRIAESRKPTAEYARILFAALKSENRDIRNEAARGLVNFAKQKPELLLDKWVQIEEIINAPHTDYCASDCYMSTHEDEGINEEMKFPVNTPKL